MLRSDKKREPINIAALIIAALCCSRAYSLDNNPVLPAEPATNSRPSEEITRDAAVAGKSPVLQSAKYKVDRIIIDPGHGGKDPGSMAKDGLQEKSVTLDIALKAAEVIRKRLKKEVILTRDKDVYVGLHERIGIANRNGGDLFLSIHVNANTDNNIHGPKIYTYSSINTDRISRMLAIRENIEYIKPASMKRILSEPRSKLLDHLSLFLAGNILGNILSNVDSEAGNKYIISRAPFYVIEHVNMPAALLEVGFITNTEEERKLRVNDFRYKLAAAICKGVEDYIRATTGER